jgi:hypothetical protein
MGLGTNDQLKDTRSTDLEKGHALIADALAAEVEQLPSFRRFVDQIGNAPAR